MKKILFLLLITISGYGQTLQNPTYGNTTTNTLKIKTPLNYSTDFDPLLSQDPLNSTIKKRDLQPESSHLDPAYIPIIAWGDSLTAGFSVTPYPTRLAALLGYPVTNNGVGGETSTQIRTRMIADVANYSKSVIIWAGRNNFSDPTTVKADIAAMISALGHTRYLVLGILNSTNGYIGTTQYTDITSLNADLKTIYGSKYVPIREVIVNAYNPSLAQDVIDHANDVPPESLRITGDALHLNSAGYSVVAAELYKRLGILYNQNAYLQSKDIEYYIKNSTSAVHTTGNETIAGVKTFSSSPIVPDATTSTQAVNKGQLDAKVTGTGATGQVPYFSATNTLSGSSVLQWDSTNSRLGINVVSVPAGALDVRAEGLNRVFGISLYSNTLTAGATIIGTRVGGTKAANTGVLANMLMTSLQATGHNGTSSGNISGRIDIYAKQDFSVGNEPTYMTFGLTPVTGIFAIERMRLESTGNLLIATTTDNTIDRIQVAGTASGTVDATLSNQFARFGQVSVKANTANPTFTTGITTPAINLSGQTASTIAIIDASKNVTSATTATYPSLTELSYGKGVTSPIQAQIDSKANLASPALTGTPTAPTATAGTNTTQIATTAFVLANARPYKVYVALLSQTGTSAPVATVLENTLGGTVVWTRSVAGLYLGTLSGAFTASKTICFSTVSASSIGTPTNVLQSQISRDNSNDVKLAFIQNATGLSDVFTDLNVEIRVYP